jgi:hypothetical protein
VCEYVPTAEQPEYVLNIQPCPTIILGTKWTGLWHIDVSLHSNLPDQYGGFSTVFVASSVGIKPYENQQILFQACDPILHKRIPEIKQEFDFVNCGTGGSIDVTESIYGERNRVMLALREQFTFNDFGKGHKPEVYVRNINTAKVQVVVPGLGSNRLGMCAQRFFECLAIGPVLAYYTPDMEFLGLEEGKDYFSFKSPEEMMTKMKKLVNDESLRNWMASNGRAKALLYHSYKNRLIGILSYLYD